VRDIENAHRLAHGMVFVEVGGVADGHFVARKGHNFGSELLVKVMERDLFQGHNAAKIRQEVQIPVVSSERSLWVTCI
jgi:hypothetical protein